MFRNNDLSPAFRQYAADHFPQTSELRVAQSILLVCWCRETAHPAEARLWTASNPSIGQADVTALAVQNLVGGTVVQWRLTDGQVHYFNRVTVCDRVETVDITRPDLPTARPNAQATSYRAMLTGRQSSRARRGERYDLLKSLIRQRLQADPLGWPAPQTTP